MSSSGGKSWRIIISIQDVDVEFKMDTGAEVTAISAETFKRLGGDTLDQSTKKLCGPSRQPLQVLGKFEGSLRHGTKTVIQTIFVINGLKTNLLGLPAITALNLATRNDSVEIDSIIEENADIFSGLGNLGAEYEIKLDKNAVPYALHTTVSM